MASAPEHYAQLLQAFAERTHSLLALNQLGQVLRQSQRERLDQLPLPGGGATLQRWRTLAEMAGFDLALVKLFEGHTDALAILSELGAAALAGDGLWAVWAAEPPQARVTITGRARAGERVQLQGRKAWCSGARQVDQALITAWDEQQRPQLVAVVLAQPGVQVTDQGWQAVGMAPTASVEVLFDGAHGQLVGDPGQYLARPGFWHGGAGVAACWYGAAVTAGEYLRGHCVQRRDDPHADAHLGAVDAHLGAARAALQACAQWLDAHPVADARLPVQRLRAIVEHSVEGVLNHVGRALGATPFCRQARFARLFADLPVFIRQSHAERDLAGLGQLLCEQPSPGWSL
ncbi:acyl-CoA dehydrogenase family protein [Pseudomonas typographi]|uniref:acyl-CoA dehydrogenase family protein n=1 Tax=Pseudomonas typographi TaxID=2715964 RepID=UPI0016883396|nr:acyl-CoA dehydrogenase family protein [Pseudomonas typographi]MBD1551676.1 acyl-CoA dehydrogenase [Pseudomonas typographi]MBD1587069.1 acyl-CoA dehydrogenase [Pseudomonas typographi]